MKRHPIITGIVGGMIAFGSFAILLSSNDIVWIVVASFLSAFAFWILGFRYMARFAFALSIFSAMASFVPVICERIIGACTAFVAGSFAAFLGIVISIIH